MVTMEGRLWRSILVMEVTTGTTGTADTTTITIDPLAFLLGEQRGRRSNNVASYQSSPTAG